ncbi:unnamed protein product [Chironomus riparius]|uniref:BTB domain-containing protein n=1 Tax=Chironomus riparius TaxID=315576 RepID=A0A9N9S9D8_9DIPT|nr:unnamed protein product [Chironomus riparius]
MELRCRFIDFTFAHGEKFYGCKVENQQIINQHCLKFIGKHDKGKTDDDVLYVMFSNCNMARIPQGIKKHFWNMKILDIDRSKLKQIEKLDLAGYKILEKFICYKNELELLHEDLFEDFKHLEFIDFCGNNLKVIEPNILDGLERLANVNFGENPNYDKFYSIYPIYNTKSTLDEVKAQLVDKFFSLDSKLIEIYLKKLQNPVQMLKIFSNRTTNSSIKSIILEFRLNFLEKRLESLSESLETEKLQKLEITKNFQLQIDSLTSQLDTGILGDLKRFLKNENIKDFTVKVDDREFQVHKFLLAVRSPTLAGVLYKNPEAENLKLLDVSAETFEIILKFFYTDELPSDAETNFLHLFVAAGRLKVEELKKCAATKLHDQIDANNALEIFKLSSKFQNDELKVKSFAELRKKYSKIEIKDEWIKDSIKVEKIIERFERKEEAIRKIEIEFED